MKKNQSTFTFVFSIYVITAIAAIAVFHHNGSYLSRKLDQKLVAEQESADALTQSPAEPVSSNDTVVGIVDTPSIPEEIVEEVPNEPEPEPEVVEEPEDSPVIQEPEEEPEPEIADTDDDKVYYGFMVKPGTTLVRVRETSDPNGPILCRINGGDKGYVIEKGDKRSHVVLDDGTVGYVFNAYLEISEISKDEVPEEYR